MPSALHPAASPSFLRVVRVSASRDEARLSALVAEHLDRAARVIRSMGASPDDLEDLVHQAFSITAARLDSIVPGKESAFLISTAVRLTSDMRRMRARLRQTPTGELPDMVDEHPSPEDLCGRRQAFGILRHILDEMDEELRVVFVLFEVEDLSMADIAPILGIPPGTVASRLRRAREVFLARVGRLGLRAPGGAWSQRSDGKGDRR